MTAKDVLTTLRTRWPAGEYVMIEEAPQSSDRQGRKLDALVISCWRSRGHTLDGVEVKVSVNDWRRELANAGKSDWWWRHVHRFWVAVPVAIAPQVQDGLPPGWGLLAANDDKVREVVKPTMNRTPEPLEWNTTIGLLRALEGCSTNALVSAREQGRRTGRDEAAQSARGNDGRTARDLAALRASVEAFEEASGLRLGIGEEHARTQGLVSRLLRSWNTRPEQTAQRLERFANELAKSGKDVRAIAAAIMEPEQLPPEVHGCEGAA